MITLLCFINYIFQYYFVERYFIHAERSILLCAIARSCKTAVKIKASDIQTVYWGILKMYVKNAIAKHAITLIRVVFLQSLFSSQFNFRLILSTGLWQYRQITAPIVMKNNIKPHFIYSVILMQMLTMHTELTKYAFERYPFNRFFCHFTTLYSYF